MTSPALCSSLFAACCELTMYLSAAFRARRATGLEPAHTSRSSAGSAGNGLSHPPLPGAPVEDTDRSRGAGKDLVRVLSWPPTARGGRRRAVTRRSARLGGGPAHARSRDECGRVVPRQQTPDTICSWLPMKLRGRRVGAHFWPRSECGPDRVAKTAMRGSRAFPALEPC
jgi:hypothetical protein